MSNRTSLELNIPLLDRTDSTTLPRKYYSDTSPMAASRRPESAGEIRARQLLDAMSRTRSAQPSVSAAGQPSLMKQKRRRNAPSGRKQIVKGAGSSGIIYASAVGESIDIGLIESRWEEKQDDATNFVPASGGWESLISEDLVETAISIEKQVSYWKIFGGLDCFVFAFGCIVCWDVTEAQLGLLEEKIAPFVNKPVKEVKRDKVIYTSAVQRLFEEAAESMAVSGGDMHQDGSKSADESFVDKNHEKGNLSKRLEPKIVYGNIQMTSANSFEKLAYSYAIAQSVRLDVFEDNVADAISATSQIPVHLAKQGTVGMNNRQLSIKMGQLFLQRSNVNLHWDILDTPELFWEFDEYEQMYLLCRQYLDIDKRIDILNQRMDIMKDLFEMLQNELNVKHATKIEVIIIVLILAEVVLQVLGIVVSWITGKAAVTER